MQPALWSAVEPDHHGVSILVGLVVWFTGRSGSDSTPVARSQSAHLRTENCGFRFCESPELMNRAGWPLGAIAR